LFNDMLPIFSLNTTATTHFYTLSLHDALPICVFRRADVGMEGRARQYAEQNIRNEALRKGILPLAQKNAEARIAGLLHTLGAARSEEHTSELQSLRHLVCRLLLEKKKKKKKYI